MPYVRRRGNHLAIVHGSRHPDSKKVEQQVLVTLHSKAEALAAIRRSKKSPGGDFHALVEHRYPEVRFDWATIDGAIAEQMDHLPDLAKSREARATGGFEDALTTFARYVIETDPQSLDSARELFSANRAVLEWLTDLLDARLSATDESTPNEWSRDPFGWRLALSNGTMDPELEEQVANLMAEGRDAEAEAIFEFLVRVYPRYAEGWNYLGLISLNRNDLEGALRRFEQCEVVGRRLFPKRIAKRDYGTRLETRPYMRGLKNQFFPLSRLGRHTQALRIAERLSTECGDDITASAFRATAYLNLGEWRLAYDAAKFTSELSPEPSFLMALAAFELGDLREARARFLHGALSLPITAALLLGKRAPSPTNWEEGRDDTSGRALVADLTGYPQVRSKGARAFFRAFLDDARTVALTREAGEVAAAMRKQRGPGSDSAKYKRLFARLHELQSWRFVEMTLGYS